MNRDLRRGPGKTHWHLDREPDEGNRENSLGLQSAHDRPNSRGATVVTVPVPWVVGGAMVTQKYTKVCVAGIKINQLNSSTVLTLT